MPSLNPWRKEETKALIIFSWRLVQDMFSGILSSSTLHPCDYVYADSMWRRGGGCWVVLMTKFWIFTLWMWPDSEAIKLLAYRKKKPTKEGGLKQITSCRKLSFSSSKLFLPFHCKEKHFSANWFSRTVVRKRTPDHWPCVCFSWVER